MADIEGSSVRAAFFFRYFLCTSALLQCDLPASPAWQAAIKKEIGMKAHALAVGLTLVASSAIAGGVSEPVMEEAVVAQETSSSAGGVIVPLLLLLVIAAALAGSGGSAPPP
mgnify:CR=1 FL=1